MLVIGIAIGTLTAVGVLLFHYGATGIMTGIALITLALIFAILGLDGHV